ncbi:MAG: lipoprotein-releasing ABC transporter permease subunit [Hyphomicrobiaceae bacterium TMED74]|nr:lipoprotein-releasing system transmembrane subunit LolC [Filomicrobium sp.]RPG45596.1 MAG: lipoprotein-releasing ABC transporter permease subunit [Hyphomicrobiaceae bacterium TMED74]
MSSSTDTAPFAPFEWMLASRYLRARRKEGFISVIAGFSFVGIMLGVATLIIVMAVMNGFRNQLFEKILGLNGHAIVQKIGSGPFDNFEDVAKRLRAVDGVQKAIPLIEGQVMLSSPRQALGGFVRGMTEQGIRSLPLVAENIIQGQIDGFDNQRGIAIGSRLANDLGVALGGIITLVSPRGARTPFGTAPRTKPYRVVAIFELGMSEYDRSMVFMPMLEAQRYFSKGPQVDVIEVVIDHPENVDRHVAAMKAALGDDYNFVSWKQRNQTFFTVLEVERTVMFIILSLIVLVAALNIISGTMMLVKDKSRDIAILRTMGATKHAIMRVFLITGASIGVVGTIAGLIIGIIFCDNIESIRQFVQWLTGTTLMDPSVYYLTRLPADIDPQETAGIVIMALVLSVLATLYPSWRASKLHPVEALRYE